MKNLESNKLIAEFMNVQPIQYDEHYQWSDGVYFSISGVEKDKVLQHIYKYVKYVSSWDWIMPVVEKIEKIELKGEFGTDYYDFHIMPDAIIVCKQSDEKNPLILINKSDGIGCIQDVLYSFENKLEGTYAAVVEFIKWYNKNK